MQRLKQFFERIDRLPVSPAWRGGILAVLLMCSLGAGVSNLRISSLFLPGNPLKSAQAHVFFDDLDELEATDGTGLDEVVTDGASAGATLSFRYEGSTAPAEGVILSYVVATGSPSQSLPHIVIPGDNGTSNLYFEMTGLPRIPGHGYLVPDLTTTADFYRVGVNSAGGRTTLEVGQSAITIND